MAPVPGSCYPDANSLHLQKVCRMAGAGSLLQKRLDRRLLLAGGLAAAGGTAIAASSVHGETAHQGHGAAPLAPGGSEPLPAHAAHGAMITVGDVDDQRNGFDP